MNNVTSKVRLRTVRKALHAVDDLLRSHRIEAIGPACKVFFSFQETEFCNIKTKRPYRFRMKGVKSLTQEAWPAVKSFEL